MTRSDWFALAKHFGLLLLIAFFAIMAARRTAGAEDMPTVDVALVLAVDASTSVRPDEAALQRAGYAAAILSPEVLKAIEAGLYGEIVLTYVEWSGAREQRTVVPWTVISDVHDAIGFVKALHADKRPKGFGSNTDIASAITYSAGLLAILPVKAERHIIDISGDGTQNEGPPLVPARKAALAQGITINGLPVELAPDTPVTLADYYREFVIGGPGAFVVESKGGQDFELAVKSKIVSEIAAMPPPTIFASRE